LQRKFYFKKKNKNSFKFENIYIHFYYRLYADLRRASMNGGGVPMGVRYLEVLLKILYILFKNK